MIDPFALLQLPSTFTLSTDALDMAWMRASATAHPDAGGSVNHAAQLNEARELLANPEQRANLRLNMLGGPNADQDQRLPDGFLMEMLELRERIDAEIEAEGVPRHAVASVGGYRVHQVLQKITPVLDAESASKDDRTEVRLVLNQVRYLERLREQL